MKTKYATAITIGCRLNQADTAIIFYKLQKVGFKIVHPDTDVNLSVVVINTCAVTSSASQKSRQAARSFRSKYPNALIIVTGCSSETEKKNWTNEANIDLIIPNTQKNSIEKFLLQNNKFKKILVDNNLTSPASVQSKNKAITIQNDCFSEGTIGYYPFKSRANLKIQDGCDSFCTYCIVPYGRGEPRSRNIDDTINEFKELLKRGHREIVLTGVNIATYNDNGKDLIYLVKKLVDIPGDFRIRLSSTEPQFHLDNLIDLIKSNPKICRFLHLPLQHGTNEILKKMGRKYSIKDFTNFVTKANETIPDICIGTDIIVGFPGETDELFNQMSNLIEKLPLAYLHIFKYSKREGTPAARFKDQVPNKISFLRHKHLRNINKILSSKFLNSQIGKTATILVESINQKNELVGWTDNYIKLKIKNYSVDQRMVNRFIDVKLESVSAQREMYGINQGYVPGATSKVQS